MSDCFDHMLDAFDSLDWDEDYSGGLWESSYNSLAYHTTFKVHRLIRQTPKAVLIHYKHTGTLFEMWLPKSVIHNYNSEATEYTVHRNIFWSNLKKAKKVTKLNLINKENNND